MAKHGNIFCGHITGCLNATKRCINYSKGKIWILHIDSLKCQVYNFINVSQELIDLLKYFEETTVAVARQSDSDKIHKMQQIVESIRENENVGVKFMNAWEEKILDRQEAHDAGVAEGLEKGLSKGIEKTALRMKEEGFEYEVISRITNLPVEDIERL